MDDTLTVYGQGFDQRIAAAAQLLRGDEACALTEEMFSWLETHGIGPAHACAVVHACAFAIVQTAVERNASISDAQMSRLLARLPMAKDTDLARLRTGFLGLLRETLALLSEERSRHSRAYLYEVKHYIEENFDKRISLKQLAERVFVDAFYLGKEFRRRFGCSVSEYQNTLRIERAIKLLETTELRLHEIAAMVGYNNYNNFYHNFRRMTGMNPEQYIREERL